MYYAWVMSMEALRALQKENKRLREENQRLRTLLQQYGISFESHTPEDIINQRLRLYRSFFRGREDVYAQRWYRKDGKKQYSPMFNSTYRYAGKEAQEAAKKRGEYIYEPLDDEALNRHLRRDERNARHAYGIYLIVNDDEVYVAAMDFDGAGWKRDIQAIVAIVQEYEFPHLIECSQSGEGAHLWFFFEESIKAKKARELLSSFVTIAMQRHPFLQMESYDRIFPSQERVTVDGLGSLIALPLEGEARRNNRTVFLDAELNVQVDPWAVLRDLQKISLDAVDRFLVQIGPAFDVGKMGLQVVVERQSELALTMAQDRVFAREITATLASGISFPIANLPASLINDLKRIASFHNPEFYKAQRLRLSTWDTPRVICRAELQDDVMTLPRGCYDAVKQTFENAGVALTIADNRSQGSSVSLQFAGELRDEQQAVVSELKSHNAGVLSAPTGFGKTVVGAALLAELNKSALIIVHTRPLLLQWKKRIREFLGVEAGLLGGGNRSLTGGVDIALINSLSQDQYEEQIGEYGVVLVDECHHVGAVSYEQVLQRVKAAHVYGFTATAMRSDGHQAIIFMQCGPLLCRIDPKEWREKRELVGRVVTSFTPFRCNYRNLRIQEIYEALANDEERNQLIANDVAEHAKEGRSILVLANRVDQLSQLETLLQDWGLDTLLLVGGQATKKKRELQAQLQHLQETNTPALILSTGKYIGEGFDFPSLDTLVLAAPVAWKGSIIQYVGRVSRWHEGKTEAIVLDYIDFKIPVLARMFTKWVRAFKDLGFSIAQMGQKTDEELLYTKETYWEALQRDINATDGDVFFSVPYLSTRRVHQVLPFLIELATKRSVTIQMPSKADATLFSNTAVEIIQTEKELVTCMVIGEQILWYGSINVLGNIQENDTLLRIEDATYVDDLRKWLQDDG